MAAALSWVACTRGTATPPLPSPPRTARCSRIASETNAWPTGVRTTARPVPGRDAVDEAARGDVRHDAAPRARRGLPRRRAAASAPPRAAVPASSTRLSRSPSASRTRPRSARPARHERAHLGGRGDARLGRARERQRRVVVDRQHVAAERLEPARHEARARAVAAVDRDAQPPRAHQPRRRTRRAAPRGAAATASCRSTRVAMRSQRARGDRALVVDVEQLLALDRAEVEPVVAHELERVPLRRVVAAGDRDAAARAEAPDRELQAGRRADAEVDRPRSRRRGDPRSLPPAASAPRAAGRGRRARGRRRGTNRTPPRSARRARGRASRRRRRGPPRCRS